MPLRTTLVGLLVLCMGCAPDLVQQTWTSTTVDGSGNTVVETMGPRLELGSSVRYQLETHSSSNGPSSSSTTLNGQPFGLRGGVFFIGAQEYGPVPAGVPVRATQAGVFVGGELRGPLPGALPETLAK